MKNRFYLACTRDNVGSNMAFHAVGGYGYVTDLDKAEQYTREEAQKEWDMGREIEQPVSADHVDELCVLKVDMQYIPSESVFSGDGMFFAFKKGVYDGNDVYWKGVRKTSTNFTMAIPLDKSEAIHLNSDFWVVVPSELADSKKRRTFDHRLLNKRVMVQGAGLVTPDHIKREKRRSDSGKERWNCPACGRINWQRHPYDFMGCTNSECEEFTTIDWR